MQLSDKQQHKLSQNMLYRCTLSSVSLSTSVTVRERMSSSNSDTSSGAPLLQEKPVFIIMHRSVKLLRCTPFVQQRLSLYSPEVELAGDRKDHHALPSLDRLDDLERHACRSAFRRCRPGALYGTLMPWISRRIMSHVTLASFSAQHSGERGQTWSGLRWPVLSWISSIMPACGCGRAGPPRSPRHEREQLGQLSRRGEGIHVEGRQRNNGERGWNRMMAGPTIRRNLEFYHILW